MVRSVALSIGVCLLFSSQAMGQGYTWGDFQNSLNKNKRAENGRRAQLAKQNQIDFEERMKVFRGKCENSNSNIRSESNQLFGVSRRWTIQDSSGVARLGIWDSPNLALCTNIGPVGGIKRTSLSPADQVHLKLFESWSRLIGRRRKIWEMVNGPIVNREQAVVNGMLHVKNIARMDLYSKCTGKLTSDFEGNDFLFLLQMSSMNYLTDDNVTGWENDIARIRKISEFGDENHRELARWIMLREIAVRTQEDAKEQFGEHFSDAVKVAQLVTLSEVAKNVLRDSDELDWLVGAANVFESVIPIVSQGIESEKRQLACMTNFCALNRIINLEIDKLLQSQTNKKRQILDFSEYFRQNTNVIIDDKLEGYIGFCVNHKIKNESSSVIKRCLVKLEYDCHFNGDPAYDTVNILGQGLLNVVLTGGAPDYHGRDLAWRKYLNVNKHSFAYVKDWQPNQEIQLITMTSPEFLASVRGVKIQIGWDKFHTDANLKFQSTRRKVAKLMGRKE